MGMMNILTKVQCIRSSYFFEPKTTIGDKKKAIAAHAKNRWARREKSLGD